VVRVGTSKGSKISLWLQYIRGISYRVPTERKKEEYIPLNVHLVGLLIEYIHSNKMFAKQIHSSLFDTKSLPSFHPLKATLIARTTSFDVQELFSLTKGCRFDVLTVALMTIQVLWGIKPCRLRSSSRIFGEAYCLPKWY
jgi:hypothetical protein